MWIQLLKDGIIHVREHKAEASVDESLLPSP